MSNINFHVIGIGFSAGGQEPLIEIVSALPPDINAAIIIVQHFPDGLPSNMDSILQRYTKLHVVAVDEMERVEPGKIYVMAFGAHLRMQDQFVAIEPRDYHQAGNHSIDKLFKSVAAEAQEFGVGVILSGAGDDGLEGAKAIEQADGIVIVQDPPTAKFPMMPRMLIAYDHPDYVLKPADISKKIIDHVGDKK